jgi:hypothetical protein
MIIDIQKAKEILPLPSLVKRMGFLKLRKGENLCPFHSDKKPSFSIFNKNGLWFFKCHGECYMAGDEITFIEKALNIKRGAAIAFFLSEAEKAAEETPPVETLPPIEEDVNSITERNLGELWEDSVKKCTKLNLLTLELWRGYSKEFCQWLVLQKLIGLYQEHFSFPVHGEKGVVVGFHYYLKKQKSWRFYGGCRLRPLVIGDTTK